MRTGSICLLLSLCIVLSLCGHGAFAAQTMMGTVASVASDGGYLRVDTDDGTLVIEPANNIKIMRGQVGMDLRTVKLQEFAPGDRIVAAMDQYGQATSLKAFFGIIKGTFAKLDGQKLVFSDGRSVPLIAQTQVVSSDGKSTRSAEIRKDSTLVCRINPITGQAWTVLVSTPPTQAVVQPARQSVPGKVPSTPAKDSAEPKAILGPSPVSRPKIMSITYSAPSPLKAGDLVTVDLTGTPGAKATFEIKNLIQQASMKEISAGVYHATVTVPKGKTVIGAPLVGRLEINGVKAPSVQASRLVTVESSIPPSVILVKAEPVDNSKPGVIQEKPKTTQQSVTTSADKVGIQLAPKVEPQVVISVPKPEEKQPEQPAKAVGIVITAPVNGASIQRSLMVKGKADPDKKLQVVITYNNSLTGIRKLSGEVAAQLLAVGKDGEFQMGPIALEGPLATKGLEFAVKAYYPDLADHCTAMVKVIGARN